MMDNMREQALMVTLAALQCAASNHNVALLTK
jgi:hypothetical protein